MAKPLPHSKPLEQFLKTFHAHVEPSNRRFRRLTSGFSQDWLREDLPNGDFKISHYEEEVEGVAIHIPIYKLEEFLAVVPEQYFKELDLRLQYPALKKSYENYKLLLKMCGGDPHAGH